MRTLYRSFAVLVVFALIITSCGTSPPINPTGYPGGGVVMAAEPEEPEPPFTLSEGTPEYTPPERPPLAETHPLDRDGLQQLLARLPQLEPPATDVQEYALPEEALPPPRPGEEVDIPFPPPEELAPPTVEMAGPLEVVRYAPEGDVPMAPHVSVTFNQPMVPLGTHEQLDPEEVPVRLSPQVPGHWRWLGTRTVLFEPQVEGLDRLPMATEYTVEIPAGTRSVLGNELAETVRWTFRTPPPTLERSYPTGGPHDLEPLIFAAFDQRIDPEAVLPFVDVSAGRISFPLRLATEEEIQADRRIARLVEDTPEGRWIVFRATEPFPKNTTVNVTFLPGMPSAEGPRTTEKAQSFSFQTYGPLFLVRAECAWSSGDECPPFSPWILEFSNPLDGDAFDPAWVQVTPDLPGMQIDLFGNGMAIRGNTQPHTTYQVRVAPELQDIFGQTLDQEVRATFRVGAAEPMLTTGAGPFALLDPTVPPSFSIYSVNVGGIHVQAYRVEPEDFPDYLRYLNEWAYRRDVAQRPDPPGRKVMDQVLSPREQDTLVETTLDLREAMGGGTGNLILIIEPDVGFLEGLLNRDVARYLKDIRYHVWVQATQIGLDAFVDQDEMVVWANRLQDGAPLGDVQVTLWPTPVQGTTDETGVARLPLPSGTPATMILARHGDDVAFIPASTYYYAGSGWERWPETSELRWYVFDDRQMYRPGETVHLKGWVRSIQHRPDGDVTLAQGVRFINYVVTEPQGNEIARGEVPVNDLGGFHLEIDLPENINLGYVNIELRTNTLERYVHSVQVQEFRRPEFEVVTSAPPGPHLVNEHAVVSVEARYFAGGPLPGADVSWLVTASEGTYRPPNWDDFVFGRWTPWWGFVERGFGGFFSGPTLGSETFQSRTDAAGRHNLRIDFRPVDPPQPVNITAEATVFDVNRQAWSDATTLLVHPAELYVGLRTDRYFVERGEPLEVEVAVATIDGKAVPGHPVNVRAARLEWAYRQGEWREEEKDVQECQVRTTAADDPRDPQAEFASCTFATEVGGTYRITATIEDGQGRRNETTLTRWVGGGGRPPSRNLEQEEVLLIPNADEYRPGDVAEILVQSPFGPAEGVVTLRRDGLVSTERFTMDGPTYTLQVPIQESHIPNLFVQVDLVGKAPRLDDQGNPIPGAFRPAYASGYLNLQVPPYSRTLQVEATPQETALEPGGKTTLDLRVTDAQGNPVANAELAVVVVDEAILSLTGYRIPDPVQVFYTMRGMGVDDLHNRADILLASPELVARQALGMGGGGAPMATDRAAALPATPAMEAPAAEAAMPAAAKEASAPAGPAIRVRIDFNPLALFAPEMRTDADGRASVPITLPDNLTRYRVTAVAVAGENRFGMAEASITARLPLMVRPSPPRFLNFGDRFELPVVLQNQTDEPLDVAVALEAANLDLTGTGTLTTSVGEAVGVTVTVPANDRVEVRFPATTRFAGTARLQVGATVLDRPQWADAAQVSLPVWTPATTEAFAVYGVVDEGAVVQPFLPPQDVIPVYGGLEVSTSSTALQALTDAYLYLVRYPFECSEQIASRLLGIAALRDVLAAFDAPGLPTPETIQSVVARDIQTLEAMQNADGGFPIWRRGDPSWPYYSIHVTHALARAQMKGYDVPPRMLERALDHLRNIDRYIPDWYGRKSRNSLRAYALYVRSLLGDVDLAQAQNLWQREGTEYLSMEAMGWLLYVMAGQEAAAQERQAILRHFLNNVTETAGAANFVDGYGDDTYVLLYSDRRADAIILEALMAEAPDSDLIPKVVRGLLAHRKKGRWANTQENAFVLLALDGYFQRYEAQSPDFVARVWLGDQYVGGHEFRGRTTEIATVQVPMAVVQDLAADVGPDGTLPLILQKDGVGRLYYRLGLRYAPTDLRLDPADHGFTVLREYEAVDDPEDVWRDEEGVWHVKAGARVRVRVTMVAESRRYHVALVDPLPAGLEALNPALAVTGSIPADPQERARGYYGWWWRYWYEHQNLRDERAEAFTSLLWAGVYEYTYVARATTPGRFVVPPAKAEEMYAPEVFGRSGTDILMVE